MIYQKHILIALFVEKKNIYLGEVPRTITTHSVKTKNLISASVKKYAKKNPTELKERAQKGINTKRKNGYDFATFSGKNHTPVTRLKISNKSKESNLAKSKKSIEQSVIRAKEANLSVLNDLTNGIAILQCNKCGAKFEMTRQYLSGSKIHDKMCPCCYPRDYRDSILEKEIREYISSTYNGILLFNDRSQLQRQELDIYLPTLRLSFEINGLYWHSQLLLEKNGYDCKKDFQKYLSCKNKNIKLITIHEDEWYNKQAIVKSRITGMIKKNKSLYARKTTFVELSSKDANIFLKQNHLQGSGRSNVRLGLMYNDSLVAVMTFSKENISRKSSTWEINRFCNILHHTIVGGASKLLSHFVQVYSPKKIISFSDNRWGDGYLYKILGFQEHHSSPPTYWYFKSNEKKKYHRYSLRKTTNDDPSLTEWENRKLSGWNRIYDCGHTKWQINY